MGSLSAADTFNTDLDGSVNTYSGDKHFMIL